MKMIIFALAASATYTLALADNYTQGYQRQNGTYVQPHYQTAPDNTRTNNYSSQGNTNPYTGQQGHVDPYKQPEPQQYDYQNNGQQHRQKSAW